MRRIVVALLVGVLVASVAYGLAAGLDVFSDDLGAGSDVVAACDVDGVNVSYQVGFASGDFDVTSVDISNIDDTNCTGEELTIVLSDASDTALYTGTTTIAGATASVTPTGVLASAVEGVHVAITGDDPTP